MQSMACNIQIVGENSLLNALRASLGGCVAARAHRDACVLLDNHRMVRTHVCCFLVIAF